MNEAAKLWSCVDPALFSGHGEAVADEPSESGIVWQKMRKYGGSDGRGVGFCFRNVTELCLFGVRGKNARKLAPGRRQVNLVGTPKREHSRKPDEFYDVIESCSAGARLELFARGARDGWTAWGNQAEAYEIGWKTYAHNSRVEGAAEWAEAAE